MDSSEVWRWVWLAAALAFTIGEIATAGSFFLLPFGIGAAAACLLAFLDVGLGWQWLAFVAVAAAFLAALYPLRKHLDRAAPQDKIQP